jgi:hypothetical protein
MTGVKNFADDAGSAQIAADRRWNARRVMNVPVVLKDPNGRHVPASIVNMAEDGLMIEFDSSHEITTYSIFLIEIEGHCNLQCYAVWTDRSGAGMQLTLPVHPAVLDGLARKYPTPTDG